jgi:23S rRNA G2445 N2-methylase RlmL
LTVIESHPTAVLFEITRKDWHLKMAELCYTYQGAIKVISHAQKFKADNNLDKTLSNIEKELKLLETQVTSDTNPKTLKINCVRNGIHEYKSVDLAQAIGRNYFHEVPKIMNNADMEIIVYIDNDKGYLGIDFSGRNLAKRDYKIFAGAASLRGTIAYNLFKESEATKKDFILDPFMGSGTIVIEAGLYFSKTSPFYFSKNKFAFINFIKEDWNKWFKEQDEKRDSKTTFEVYGFDALLKFLKYSQKNAKIADVNKSVNLSKAAIDWIDIKIEEDKVTKIITHPPALSENASKSKVIKVYKDLFYQADYLLKLKGDMTIITNPPSKAELIIAAKDYHYDLTGEKLVYEGQQEMLLLKFKQEKKKIRKETEKKEKKVINEKDEDFAE